MSQQKMNIKSNSNNNKSLVIQSCNNDISIKSDKNIYLNITSTTPPSMDWKIFKTPSLPPKSPESSANIELQNFNINMGNNINYDVKIKQLKEETEILKKSILNTGKDNLNVDEDYKFFDDNVSLLNKSIKFEIPGLDTDTFNYNQNTPEKNKVVIEKLINFCKVFIKNCNNTNKEEDMIKTMKLQKEENESLRKKYYRVLADCDKLFKENTLLKQELMFYKNKSIGFRNKLNNINNISNVTSFNPDYLPEVNNEILKHKISDQIKESNKLKENLQQWKEFTVKANKVYNELQEKLSKINKN